jgi:O-antigen/teichoic acid export membrane protein
LGFSYLNYFYRIVIARYFGPEAYGLFSLATMVLGLFVAVSSLGLIDGVLRYIPLFRAKNEVKKIDYVIRYTFITLLISATIFGGLLFFLSDFISLNIFHNAKLIVYLKIFGFLIPISTLSSFFLYIIRAYEKIKTYSFLQNILQSASRLAFLMLFVFLGIGANNAISFSFFSGYLVTLIIAYIIFRKIIPQFIFKSQLKDSEKSEIKKNLFSYSWPLIFSGVLGTLFYWTDSLVLGYFRSAEEVGWYNSAIPLAALLLAFSDIFLQLFYPLITKEYALKNIKLVKELSKQVAKWLFIINFPLLLVMLAFPGIIINVFFGKEYFIAENALRILAIGAFFSSLYSISTVLLNMAGKSRLLLMNTLVFVLVNFVLDILLIPRYGMNGAAFATLTVFTLSGAVIMFSAYRYLGIIPLKRKMLGISLIGLILFLPLLLLEKRISPDLFILLIIGTIFIIVYIILLYFFKCFDRNDLMIISSIRKKIIRK